MLLPAACNLARLQLFGLKFSKLNVCLRLNFVPCAVEVTSEWGVQKEADWDQKNSAKILELFSEQNQGKRCLPMATGIWQTWKAVMPFHLPVTDLKSDMRGGAHTLEVSLLLPPWKVHLHLVKCPKPNCTVCIFSRCLLGHVHILLSSSWWPDNTRDMSKYSNSRPQPRPTTTGYPQQGALTAEPQVLHYESSWWRTVTHIRYPRLPICFLALFLRERKPRKLLTKCSIKNMISKAEFRNYWN